MEDLVIKNGLVVTPQGIVRGGLAVRKEKILQIGADNSLPKASLEVDAKGNYILPGLIDPHVHIGRALEEDFTSQFKTRRYIWCHHVFQFCSLWRDSGAPPPCLPKR